MKLNPVERVLVNNPVRDVLLRSTMSWLHDAACAPALGRVLEMGCGQGEGAREIWRRFRPQRIDAFDVDPRQVERARGRLGALAGEGGPIRLAVGDAGHVDATDGTYDAVLELMILHHVPDWRRALGEIRRVLRPGGLFLFQELSREFFHDTPLLSPLLRRLTVHPWDEMFDFPTFRSALADAGLRLTALRSQVLPGWHQGVAVREGGTA
jgi:ubiquinone/menaquinone biosynthesis C-methylase UbiE